MGKFILGEEFNGPKDYLLYCYRRYMRFWPMYAFIIVLLTIIVLLFHIPGRSITIWQFFVNFLFIIHPGCDYVDGSHWFLSVLLMCQFVSALFVFVPKFNRISAILFLSFIIGGIYFFLPWSSSLLFQLLSSEAKILLGIIIYIFKCNLNVRYLLVFLIFSLMILFSNSLQTNIQLLLFCYFCLFYCLIKNIRFHHRMLWLFKNIGEMSLTYYLIHSLVGFSVLYHFCPKGEICMLWLLLPVLTSLVLTVIIWVIFTHLRKRLTLL